MLTTPFRAMPHQTHLPTLFWVRHLCGRRSQANLAYPQSLLVANWASHGTNHLSCNAHLCWHPFLAYPLWSFSRCWLLITINQVDFQIINKLQRITSIKESLLLVSFVVHIMLAHRWRKLSIFCWRHPKTSMTRKVAFNYNKLSKKFQIINRLPRLNPFDKES